MLGALLTIAATVTGAPSDAIAVCNPVDAQQHRLCKMRDAGSLFGVPAEMRFVETDLMTMRRTLVVYVFPPRLRATVEKAVREGLLSADERIGGWGHDDDSRSWTTSDRRYRAEMDNGKFTVRISGRTPTF